jgi:hypothetical protein
VTVFVQADPVTNSQAIFLKHKKHLSTIDELRAYNKFNRENFPEVIYPEHLASKAPKSFDPRKDGNDVRKKCALPIMYQDQCGSCWAFSSAATFSDK